MTNDQLRKWAAIVIITIWTLAAIVALIRSDVLVLGAVTPVMMFAMGFLFGFGKPNLSNGGKE